MRKIIYTLPNGNLAVVHPVRNNYPSNEELSDAEIEQRAWDKLPADAINPRFAEASEIPTDRTFRAAWVDGGSGVSHDMAKCREIHKNNLRAIRAPILAALDLDYMRADEAGDGQKKAQIKAKKQALRDVTADPSIAAAKTPNELKNAIPEALK